MSYIPIAGYVAKAPFSTVLIASTNDPVTIVNYDPEGGILHRVRIEATYNESFANGQEARFRIIVDGVNGDWIPVKTTGEGLFSVQGFANGFRTVFDGVGNGTSSGDYRVVSLNAFYQASLKIEFQYPSYGGTPQYRISVFRSQRVA